MAIITIQGFDSDDWSTMMWQGWSEEGSVSHLASGGRRETGAISMLASNAEARYTLPSAETDLIVGFAVYFGEATLTQQTFFTMRDESATTNQLSLRIETTGALSIIRGASTLVETSAAGIITPQRWMYLEMQASISNTVGRYHVRVNESSVLNRVNVDTQQSANATVDQLRFAYMGGASDAIDDLYVLDTGGTINHELLGDMIVDTKTVDGNGTTNDWTPLSGNNYEMVDEALQDGDTTYCSSSTVGHIDLFTVNPLTNLGVTGTVNCVMVCNAVRHDGGSQDVRSLLRTGGSNSGGVFYTTTGAYEYCEGIWERNPDTLAAWTESEVNALEIGILVVT